MKENGNRLLYNNYARDSIDAVRNITSRRCDMIFDIGCDNNKILIMLIVMGIIL